ENFDANELLVVPYIIFVKKTDFIVKRFIIHSLIILLVLFSTSCASSKVKKRSQPKRGPIPCPMKDC
ncbi:MAG: hypothetical protein KAK04_03260, partial [Cyclobacteriaceae bacterium]|nr:hypothetical protein [Cyclobacteriaceae bacterium]